MLTGRDGAARLGFLRLTARESGGAVTVPLSLLEAVEAGPESRGATLRLSRRVVLVDESPRTVARLIRKAAAAG